MPELLCEADFELLEAAETRVYPAPIPTRPISNGEFMPGPQSGEQKRVEARIKALADANGRKQGLSRRAFLRTASGMAASFVALNEVFGPLFDASPAEAATPELAQERAGALARQFIFDGHTHFLRPDAPVDSPLRRFVNLRKFAAQSVNKELAKEEQTFEHLQFQNYVKEMFLDSDTKLAILSGAPADIPGEWFLTNEMKAEARARVNGIAGSRRLMTHAIFTPGVEGWLDDLDRAIEVLKPDSWKGYTVGDNQRKNSTRSAWRMDDEKVAYPGYERMLKAGIRNVCVHKGLFPISMERQFPHLVRHCNVDDVGKAARDWPQLNFIIYHSGYRHTGGPGQPGEATAQFESTGRLDWVSDLAEIPAKFGVNNVYGDLGSVFGGTVVSQPRVAAAMLGILVRGLGADRVVWGTDSVWTGTPQWQIEALRRLEIPEDMRKAHGFAQLGEADGLVKSAIFGFNAARLYNIELEMRRAEWEADRLTRMRAEYRHAGVRPSNRYYGFVAKENG
jgi:predicted TIM-barrel fold metal-dependent hydrolase